MTSPLEAYLRDNPGLRTRNRGDLLDELYQTSGVQEPFQEFSEKLLRDDEDRAGIGAAFRKGLRMPAAEPYNPPEPPSPPAEKRGFSERIAEGTKQGYGPNPTILERTPAGAVTGAVIRGFPTAVGALGGVISGAHEFLDPTKDAKERADRLQRDVGPMATAATVVAGGARNPMAEALPTGVNKQVQLNRERTLNTVAAETNARIAQLEYDIGELTRAGKPTDNERLGAAKAELENVRTYRDYLYGTNFHGKRKFDAILSKIVPHPEGPQSAIMRPWDWWYTDFKDRTHPFNKAVKMATGSFTGKHKMPDEYNPHLLMRLFSGNAAMVEHLMKKGTVNPLTLEITGKPLREIASTLGVDDLPNAVRYAVAKRVLEKEGQGIYTGFDFDQAKQIVMSVDNLSKSDPRYTKFTNFAEELTAYNRRMLEYLVSSGVYSRAQADQFIQQNLFYLPFYRLMDETSGAGIPGGRSANPIKAMTGSGRDVLEPMESIVRNTRAFVDIAERNRAMYWLTRMAQEYGLPEIAQRVVYEGGREAQLEKSANSSLGVFRQENSMTPVAQGVDPLVVFKPEFWKPASNEIVVMKNGEREVWRVDPAIAEAWSNIDPAGANWLHWIMSLPAKTLRAGATRTPDFPLANIWRDQPVAMLNSQYGYTPLHLLLGLRDALPKGLGGGGSEGYWEWMRARGGNSMMTSLDSLKGEAANMGIIPMTPKQTAMKWGEHASGLSLLSAWSNFTEEMTRVSGYLNARNKGANPTSAAYESRELTLDFLRSGAKSKALTMLVAFHNAQLEGPDRLFRAFGSDPKKTAALAVGFQALPALYLWIANHDDPRYKNETNTNKNSNFYFLLDKWKDVPADEMKDGWTEIPRVVEQSAFDETGFGADPEDFINQFRKRFPQFKTAPIRLKNQTKVDEAGREVPTGAPPVWEINTKGPLFVLSQSFPVRQKPDGTWEANQGNMVKMPKSWEIGVTFASVMERMLDKYYDEDPQGARHLAQSLYQAFVPNLMPTAAAPVIEQLTGTSLFTGHALEPRAEKEIDPKFRSNINTTEAAKGFAELLDKIPGLHNSNVTSPIIIENYVRGWSGTMGIYYLKIFDAVLRASGVSDPDLSPTPAAQDIPAIKRFLIASPKSYAEPISQFYDKYIEMKQSIGTVKRLEEQGKSELADKMQEEQKYARVEEYAEQLNQWRKMAIAIYKLPLRDPKEKKSDDPNDFRMTRDEKRQMIDTMYIRMVATAKQGLAAMMEGEHEIPRPKNPPAFRYDPDPRVRQFGNARSNAVQQGMMDKMTARERQYLGPAAHKQTREMYGFPPYQPKGTPPWARGRVRPQDADKIPFVPSWEQTPTQAPKPYVTPDFLKGPTTKPYETPDYLKGPLTNPYAK